MCNQQSQLYRYVFLPWLQQFDHNWWVSWRDNEWQWRWLSRWRGHIAEISTDFLYFFMLFLSCVMECCKEECSVKYVSIRFFREPVLSYLHTLDKDNHIPKKGQKNDLKRATVRESKTMHIFVWLFTVLLYSVFHNI